MREGDGACIREGAAQPQRQRADERAQSRAEASKSTADGADHGAKRRVELGGECRECRGDPKGEGTSKGSKGSKPREESRQQKGAHRASKSYEALLALGRCHIGDMIAHAFDG